MTHALRPYQHDDATTSLAWLQRGRDPLYALPTGGGKTVTFTHITRIVRESAGWRVLILVHRRELLRQASKALAALGIAHGLIAPGHHPSSAPVHVASIDTLRVRDMGSWLAKIDLVIIDEAHHVASDSWSGLLDRMPQARKFGVTATPFRLDGKGLGSAFNEVVRGPSMKRLITGGFLVQPVVRAPITVDLSGAKRRFGDFALKDIIAAVDTPETTQAAVTSYGRWMPGRPTMVFCASVEHSQRVRDAFAAAGWRSAHVDGDMSDKDRDAAILGLADGQVQILTSCELVSEGVDLPAVAGGILLRPTASTSLYLQQVGRLLRTQPGKDQAVIVDLVGNWARHGLPDADRHWTLEGGLVGLDKAVAAARRCGKCHRVSERGSKKCPGCGYVWPVIAKQQTLPNIERTGLSSMSWDAIANMPLRECVRLARTRFDFETIARVRGYAPGWVNHAMQEHRGAR